MYKVKEEKNKGITLISLVLSIIVLLILAGVSLSLVVGETGIVERASKTKNVTETAELQEKIKIAAMAAQVEGLGTIPSIEVLKSELDSAIGTDYTIEEIDDRWQVIANKTAFNIDRNGGTEETEYFDSEEWDKTAATEDCFYWASDIEGDEGYGTVIGYKAKIQDYTVLRYPSRCTKITWRTHDSNSEYIDGTTLATSRSFTKNILKVELPATLNGNINWGVFSGIHETFKSLERIELEYGFTSINVGLGALSKLKSVVIPNSVTSVENSAFSGCEKLTNIKIPDSVTSIGDNVFSGCASLAEIIIPDSVTSIGDNAFSGCASLAEIIIPDSVTSIGDNAFSGCASLAEVKIPNSVISIGDWAFMNCTSLTEIPSNIPSLSGGLFSGCTGLSEIILPNYITTIPWDAFTQCTGFTVVIIPNNVKTIDEGAFGGCRNLRKIFIPKEVINIYSDEGWVAPFYGCSTDLQIYTDASQDNSGWEEGWKKTSGMGNSTYLLNYNTTLEEFNALD